MPTRETTVIVMLMVLLLIFTAPLASASDRGATDTHRLDLSAGLNSWRTSGEAHAGYHVSLSAALHERHRLRARHISVTNQFSNAWRAFEDIVGLCAARSDCDDERDTRRIRESAVLYEYRGWSHAHEAGIVEAWFGLGPGWVKTTLRSDQNDRTVTRETGMAWRVALVGRRHRFFSALAVEGNTEINGTVVGVGFGVGF